MLTALGVPGGTAASTFDDAYRDDASKSDYVQQYNRKKKFRWINSLKWIK